LSTILAVDDSATMRKCLEITFAGTEFNLVTCATAEEALERVKTLSPSLVIADVSLPPKDGYELCSTIKLAQPRTLVLMLSSKQSPFDAGKGGQADGHIDKPFDTQVMQDRARELIKAEPRAAEPAPLERTTASPRPPVAVSMPERAPSSQSKIPAPRRKRPTPAMMAKPAIQPPTPLAPRTPGQQAMRRTVPFAMPGSSTNRGAQAMVDAMRPRAAEGAFPRPSAEPTGAEARSGGEGIDRTLPMEARREPTRKPPMADTLPGVSEEPRREHESPRPVPVAEARSATEPAPAAPVARMEPARPQVTAAAGTPAGDGGPMATIPDRTMASLEDRLGGLGLTREQMEGVLALSRDLVEQVVWEVVPVLAETLIKEEIARLTKA
jgi:CheY-like chemotaxis protein